MRHFLRLGSLACLTLSFACGVLNPPPVGSIAGRVIIEGQGVAGVTVSLGGGPSTTTGGDGTFRFDDVEGGSYTVTISGFPLDATFPSTTASAEIDADGETATVEFRGQYIRTAALVGRVIAEGDPLGGVTVHLSGMSESLTSTDAVGQFAFANLRAGNYSVTISEFGAVQFPRTGHTVSLAVGESKVVSFEGTYPRTASISGRVTVEDAAFGGVEVTLTGFGETATVRSDANGEYSFARLRAGTYNVVISGFDPTDVVFADTSGTVQVGVGESKIQNFEGQYVRESAIVGRVSVAGTGLRNITVTLQGVGVELADTTDGEGLYSFADLRAGEYSITISDYDDRRYEFVTASDTVRVERGETEVVPFEGDWARTAAIVGQVSVGGEGLADVTVSLRGEGENRTTMTDNSGQYTFTGLRPGNYQVGISGYDTNDYSFETTSKNVALGADETATVPFEGIRLRTAAIIGQVSVEGKGLSGVTVTLKGAGLELTTTTDSTGQYAFSGLPAGNYSVSISGYDTTRYSFETTSKNVALPLSATATVPFDGVLR